MNLCRADISVPEPFHIFQQNDPHEYMGLCALCNLLHVLEARETVRGSKLTTSIK